MLVATLLVLTPLSPPLAFDPPAFDPPLVLLSIAVALSVLLADKTEEPAASEAPGALPGLARDEGDGMIFLSAVAGDALAVFDFDACGGLGIGSRLEPPPKLEPMLMPENGAGPPVPPRFP